MVVAATCPHGRQRSKCKQCGGSGICQHGRIRSKCKECGGGSICQHGRIRSTCKACGEHRCSQCHSAFCSAQALKRHIDREVCSSSTRNRQQPGTKKRRRTENTAPVQSPKRPRNTGEVRGEDDSMPPAPLVFDSVVASDEEATESGNQPKQVLQEQGLSRSVVEEFILFESCGPTMG